MAERIDKVYRVRFNEPPLANDERVEFYFSSLAAIYDVFTKEQIGCKVNQLWARKVSDGIPYRSKRCEIVCGELMRKKREGTEE